MGITRETMLDGLPVAVVDTETTGLDTSTARIVDVAVVHTTIGSTDQPVVAFQSLVNPGIPIPPDSKRITGIGDEHVRDAPAWVAVVDRVRDAMRGRLAMAHNAPYDFGVVAAETARAAGTEPPATFPGLPWVCSLLLRRAAVRRGRPGTLKEIAAEFGIVLDAHGAAGDALTTALLLPHLFDRARQAGFRGVTVGDWLVWQHGFALEQERDWANYCRRKGDAQPPRSPWHGLYGVAAPAWDVAPKTVACECGAQIRKRIGKDGKIESVEGDALHFCRSVA